MKAKISKNLIESALARCFDACERKAAESIIQFQFKDGSLCLTTKGSFTFYEEEVKIIESSDDISFCLKASTIYEFVKYVSTDQIFLAYDDEKKSCLISSSDKKSKLALQIIDNSVEHIQNNEYDIQFDVENPHEILAKLNFASKFCSTNFQDHPLTGIHCSVSKDTLKIKATNGPTFYTSDFKVNSEESAELYIPKKAPQIIKNVFSEYPLQKCSISSRTILFESNNCKLTLYVEKSEKDSFPKQIEEFLKKDPVASLKVSVFELSKTLKFFHGVFPDGVVNFTIKNDNVALESKENSMAAKEAVPVESCSGEASSAYNSKAFLDCLDALQSSWVDIEFINLQEEFYILKLKHDSTEILLCPTTF